MPEEFRSMVIMQLKQLEDLASEIQRKEVTAERIMRLIRIVHRNVELSEHLAEVLGVVPKSNRQSFTKTHTNKVVTLRSLLTQVMVLDNVEKFLPFVLRSQIKGALDENTQTF